MSKVKDFLFKYKIIVGIVVFLLLSFGIYMFVSAESDPYEDQIEVTNVKISNIKDGTAPFDTSDEAGNDQSDNNRIVRSFDSVSYDIIYDLNYKSTSNLEEKPMGIIREVIIEALLPESVNAKVALGDLLTPIGGEENKVEIGGVKYNYYKFTENVEMLAGGNEIIMNVYDINAPNGTDIKPIFRLRESTDKSIQDYTDNTDLSNSGGLDVENVKVSAKDSYAVKLYPGISIHSEDRLSSTIPFGVVLYIPNNPDKGIMGTQVPKSINLELNLTKNPDNESTVTDYSISDYNSDNLINGMPESYPQNNGTIGKDNIQVSGSKYILTYDNLTYHNGTINIGTNTKPDEVNYISSKVLMLNTTRTEGSTNNITYSINDLASVIDNYSSIVGDYSSKIKFKNSKDDSTTVSSNNAVYNLGEEFYIENKINYASKIGDTLKDGFTNYLKIDNDAIKIVEMENVSEGDKDYFIKFSGNSKDITNDNYSLQYLVGEWNSSYFTKKDNAPSYCKDVSNLTKDELMNYYGGPCITENSNVKSYSSIEELATADENNRDKIIAIKFNVKGEYKAQSRVTLDFRAIVKNDSKLSGNTYQISSRGMTNFNGEFYMSNLDEPIPENVYNKQSDITYNKMGYNGSTITYDSSTGQDGNSILVTNAKASIKEITVKDKYDVKDKAIQSGQNDPMTIEVSPIIYSSNDDVALSDASIDVYLPTNIVIDMQSGDRQYKSVREEDLDIDDKKVKYNVYTYYYNESELKDSHGIIPNLKIHANVAVDAINNTLARVFAKISGNVKISEVLYQINNPEKDRINEKNISIYNTNVIGILGTTTPTYINPNGSYTYNMKAVNLSGKEGNIELLYILPYNGDGVSNGTGSNFAGTISAEIDELLPEGYIAYYTKESSKSILNSEISSDSSIHWTEWQGYNTALTGITAIKITSSKNLSSSEYFSSKDGINLKVTTNGNKQANIYYNNFYAIHKNGDVCKNEDCSSIESGLRIYSSNVTSSSVYNRTISGMVFIDEDYDGFSSDSEKKVSNIAVDLYKTTATIEDLKDPLSVINDSDTKVAETTTQSNGLYNFSGLTAGNYYVKYTFDCDKYTVTEKNKQDKTLGDTSSIDSDAVMQAGTCSAVSNIVTLDDENTTISNIDLGLRVRQVFDVSVDKYITNVTITSNSGVESHDYDKKKQVRLDLRNLKNTSFKVTYTIEIENTKYFPGTIGSIIETIPDGMTFNPDYAENEGWYESDGYLYYSDLDSVLLMPGEKYYVNITLDLVTNSGGSYVNFVSINDLQVQSINADLTEIKDDKDFNISEEVKEGE